MEAFCMRRYGGIKPNVVAFENGRWNDKVIEFVGGSSYRSYQSGSSSFIQYYQNVDFNSFRNNGSFSRESISDGYQTCNTVDVDAIIKIKNFSKIKSKYNNIRVMITEYHYAKTNTGAGMKFPYNSRGSSSEIIGINNYFTSTYPISLTGNTPYSTTVTIYTYWGLSDTRIFTNDGITHIYLGARRNVNYSSRNPIETYRYSLSKIEFYYFN